MQRGVTWLNKSNKLVTVKWLLRIAFHVGHSSSTMFNCELSLAPHYIEVDSPSSTGDHVSRKYAQFVIDE